MSSIFGRNFFSCVVALVLPFSCFSLDAATLSVSVSPGTQTVKVKPANAVAEVGKNVAEYQVSSPFDISSLETAEVKPENPVWSCTCSSTTFVPPDGVQPVPQSPGNPSVSISGAGPSWVASVSSPNAGQWNLQFTVTITYDEVDKKTSNKVQKVVSGIGECMFKATGGNFKIRLEFDDAFLGRSETKMGVCEGALIVLTSIDPPNLPVVLSTSSGVGSIIVSNDRVTAKDTAGSGTITVNASVGGGAVSVETFSVSVVAPSGIRQVKTGNRYLLVQQPHVELGFNAVSYVEPRDVSFHYITIGEGTCNANATGRMANWNNIVHTEWFAGVSTGNAVNGCRVEGPNAGPPPYDAMRTGSIVKGMGVGAFSWNIPWRYTGTISRNIQHLLHQQNVVDKTLTISKAGNSETYTHP